MIRRRVPGSAPIAHVALLTSLLLAPALSLTGCELKERVRRYLSERDASTRRQDPKTPTTPDGRPVSSAPVEAEPNERPEAATRLKLTSELRGVRGALASAGDVDWYAIQLASPGLYRLSLEVEDATTDAHLLLGTSKTSPLRTDNVPAGAVESIELLRVDDAPVLIGVGARAGAGGKYTLRFKPVIPGVVVDAEPNDAPALAAPLREQGSITAWHDRAGDVDVFALKIEESSARAFRIEVRAEDGLRRKVELLDREDGEPFLSRTATPDAPAIIPNLGLGGARRLAWVRVRVEDGDAKRPEKPYTMRWSPALNAIAGAQVESEPNDTPAQAVALFAPSRVVGYADAEDPVDLFSIHLSDATTGRAKQRSAPGRTFEKKPGPTITPPSPTTEDMGHAPAPPPLPPLLDKGRPKHILRAALHAKRPTDRFALAWHDADGSPRDTQESARPGAPVWLCPRVVSTETQLVGVRRIPAAKDGVKAAAKRATKETGGGEAQLDYTLHISEVLGPVEIEPNNTQAQADRLVSSKTIEGTLATTGDVDVFALDIEGAGEVDARISLAGHPLDLQLRLLDSDGVVITTITTRRADGKDGWMLQSPLPPGRYFAQVLAPGARSCVPYQLTARVTRRATP